MANSNRESTDSDEEMDRPHPKPRSSQALARDNTAPRSKPTSRRASIHEGVDAPSRTAPRSKPASRRADIREEDVDVPSHTAPRSKPGSHRRTPGRADVFNRGALEADPGETTEAETEVS